ncbi:MAG: hypothetical protein CL946_00775 [Ectothiorhodospiraceae bacterium]|nr:hypothetical protein [Ectothiorhodospiraceae bacterium]
MHNVIFDLLDQWRHLPNYQLERRADIFFAPFIAIILERHFGVPVLPDIVPEFPLHLKTLKLGYTNQSVKVDYVALSVDRNRVFFVELKTDSASRRVEQDRYLKAARKATFPKLMQGLETINQRTAAKQKYLYLFRILEKLDLVEIITSESRTGAEIHLTGNDPKNIEIVYIQPTVKSVPKDDKSKVTVIHLDTVANIISDGTNDPFLLRFAESLRKWDREAAGVE